jgi:hypothetical protein
LKEFRQQQSRHQKSKLKGEEARGHDEQIRTSGISFKRFYSGLPRESEEMYFHCHYEAKTLRKKVERRKQAGKKKGFLVRPTQNSQAQVLPRTQTTKTKE